MAPQATNQIIYNSNFRIMLHSMALALVMVSVEFYAGPITLLNEAIWARALLIANIGLIIIPAALILQRDYGEGGMCDVGDLVMISAIMVVSFIGAFMMPLNGGGHFIFGGIMLCILPWLNHFSCWLLENWWKSRQERGRSYYSYGYRPSLWFEKTMIAVYAAILLGLLIFRLPDAEGAIDFMFFKNFFTFYEVLEVRH